MKNKKWFGWAFTVALASLSACSNDAEEALLQESEIQLTNVITPATRVASLDYQSTQIVEGQQVGITITGAKSAHNNIAWIANADGSLTNTGATVYWSSTPATITAYHPYNAAWTGTSHIFSVKTDQNSEVNYRNSDLLWASKTGTKADKKVALTFAHKLVKINVSLISDDIADLSTANITICGTKVDAIFNPATGTLSASSSANVQNIRAGVNTTTASAIVIPQKVASGTKFIKVEHAGKTFYYTLNADKELMSGYAHNYTLTIKKGVEIETGSDEITDWEDDNNSGTADEDTSNTDPNMKTVNNTTAGGLSSLLSQAEQEALTSLKITGYLNSDDIRLIREMAGGTYDFQYPSDETQSKLRTLDISECTLVAGGSPFGQHTFSSIGYTTSNNRIGEYAFAQTRLENVSLPKSVTILDNCILSNCPNVRSVTIPDNVTEMESYIFGGTRNLTHITLPKSLVFLSTSMFNGCRELQSISIDPSSAYYYVHTDGVLYRRNNQLYCNPAASTATEIQVQDGTTYIHGHAFACCKNLRKVTIPASITEIGYEPFTDCTNLNNITILATTPPKVDHTTTSSDGTTTTTYPSSAFDFIRSNTWSIYVPAESLETYKTAWAGVNVIINYINGERITKPLVDYLQAIPQ